MDSRRSQGPDDLRRDLGRLRAGTRLGQARRDHLLLAEGARRRGGARHDRARPARGRTAGELQAGLAAAETLPHDQGRQADRGHIRGRNDQHALDAVRRGLYRRAAVGEVAGRRHGAVRARRRQRSRDRRLGRAHALGRVSRPRSRDALEHQRLPESGRSRGRGPAGRGAGGLRQGARELARKGEGRLRHRRLSRRAARPAHLVRRDGRRRPTSKR